MEFYDFSIQLGMECHHPNWVSLHDFSEGLVETTNQMLCQGFIFSWAYEHRVAGRFLRRWSFPQVAVETMLAAVLEDFPKVWVAGHIVNAS